MSEKPPPVRILFVCLGNICRSPMAQGIFEHTAAEAGLSGRFVVDSAGTGAWHTGDPPDPRAVAAAARRGIDIAAQRARQVSRPDFEAFDHILAMDASNHANLQEMAPPKAAHKVRLFLDSPGGNTPREVPDPYYGGAGGFDDVLDLIEEGSRALLARLI